MYRELAAEMLALYANRAETAAADFQLPYIWREGRTHLTGLAIDDKGAAEDAINITTAPREDGADVLQVSISDASYLADQRKIVANAELLGKVRHLPDENGERHTQLMLPARLSKTIFPLREQLDRPAQTLHIPISASGEIGLPTLTHDILRIQKMNSEAVVEILGDPSHPLHLTLAGVARVANNIRNEQFRQYGKPEPAPKKATGHFITQQAMVAAGCAAGLYGEHHDVPLLYRNHGLQPDFLPHIQGAERRSLSGFNETWWSIAPIGPITGLPMNAPVTRPLRDFPSFANQANLATHHYQRTYPFTPSVLQRNAVRLNEYEGWRVVKKLLHTEDVANWDKGSFSAVAIGQTLGSNDATMRDLAIALFESTGTAEAIADVRQAAARYIARQPHLARKVLILGEARGKLRPPAVETPMPVLLDDNGNVYDAGPTNRTDRIAADIAFIGRVAGLYDLTHSLAP